MLKYYFHTVLQEYITASVSDKTFCMTKYHIVFYKALYVYETRVAPDTELAGYPAAGYPAPTP